MSIVFILAPLSLMLAAFFVFLFFKSVKSGQFSDLETPAHRILFERKTPREHTKQSK